jgi:hypothetical protein
MNMKSVLIFTHVSSVTPKSSVYNEGTSDIRTISYHRILLSKAVSKIIIHLSMSFIFSYYFVAACIRTAFIRIPTSPYTSLQITTCQHSHSLLQHPCGTNKLDTIFTTRMPPHHFHLQRPNALQPFYCKQTNYLSHQL